MPTYDFRCPKGHEFERFFRTISAAVAELPCPECGAVARRQLSGGAGLLFKGSGFYLTDYGKNAHRKATPAGKAGGAEADATPSEGGKPDGAKGEKPKTDSVKAEGGAKEQKPESKPSRTKSE